MTFETYPLPAGNPQLEQVTDNIAAQHEKLNGVIANLYQGTQQALASQQKALNGTVNRLTRSANGRIKNQAVVLGGVTNTLYGAVEQGIANAGQDLAVQSALLPRLAPAGIAPEGGSQPAVNPPAPFTPPGGARGGAPVSPTVPSLPPGVSAPTFSLSPQEIVPFTPVQQPSQSSPAAPPKQLTPTGPVMWLVNCATKTAEIMERGTQYAVDRVSSGQYVPIRYNVSADSNDLQYWLSTFAPNAVPRACHAYLNLGNGWPDNGDFQETGFGEAIIGEPVGTWPFDSNGAYTGQ